MLAGQPCLVAAWVEVAITGIEVQAEVGVHAHEMGVTQQLIIDVALLINPPEADALPETFNYELIADWLNELLAGRTSLIETIAMRLADRCFAHSKVAGATVHVRKPGALANGLASARVSIGQRSA